MPKFTIVFNDDSTKEIKAESRNEMIRNFSIEDATAFQADVKEIRWEEGNFCCIETISSGKISKTLSELMEK